MKRLLAGGLVLGAALWSGAWVYGKGAIRDAVDEQIVQMRGQGIDASYEEIEIGGFPFGYESRVIAPRYAMTAPAPEGAVTYRWDAPWIEVDASAADLGGLSFQVPEAQRLVIEPPAGAPRIEVAMTSTGFRGRVGQADNRLTLDAEAQDLAITVASPEAPEAGRADIALKGMTFRGIGPETADGAPLGADFDTDARADRAEMQIIAAANTAQAGYRMESNAETVVVTARTRGGRIEAETAMQNVMTTVALADPDAGSSGGSGSVLVGAMSGQASAPAYPSGRTELFTASLDLSGVQPDTAFWRILDPAGAFPRTIDRFAVDAEAMTVIRGGVPALPEQVTVRRLMLDGLGLEVHGDGSGTVIGGIPEGRATLRLSGVGSFIDNAVDAGLMPEQQATVYKLMLESVGRAGETPEEKVFTLLIREGLTFVNGFPLGPAPRLNR